MTAQLSAAHGLSCLLGMLLPPCTQQLDASTAAAVTLATHLASRFINGSRCAASGGCSCCLVPTAAPSSGARAGAAPVLAFSRAGNSVQLLDGCTSACIGGMIHAVLTPWQRLLVLTSVQAPADRRQLLASPGGLALELQYLALAVLQARQRRAGGTQPRGRRPGSASGRAGASSSSGRRSSSSGGDGVSGRADLAAFLGDVEAWDPAVFPALLQQPEEHELLTMACCVAADMCTMGSVGSAAECPRCAPAQLRLILEAATMYPPAAASPESGAATWLAGSREDVFEMETEAIGRLCDLVLAKGSASGRPWQPAFMQTLITSVTPWVLAAAEHLRTAGPSPTHCQHCQLRRLLAAVSALLLPVGGLLRSPAAHSQPAPLEQLLAAADVALRTVPADMRLCLWHQAMFYLLKVSGSSLVPCFC